MGLLASIIAILGLFGSQLVALRKNHQYGVTQEFNVNMQDDGKIKQEF